MPCFTDVFRECGGARCVHGMVQYEACRQQALSIIQQLILSPQGDDDMATLLGLMHTSPVLSLKLKTHILKVLRLVHFCLSPRHKSHILKILRLVHFSLSHRHKTHIFKILRFVHFCLSLKHKT